MRPDSWAGRLRREIGNPTGCDPVLGEGRRIPGLGVTINELPVDGAVVTVPAPSLGAIAIRAD